MEEKRNRKRKKTKCPKEVMKLKGWMLRESRYYMVYIYIYIYICVCVCVFEFLCVCVYIYSEREKEREREREWKLISISRFIGKEKKQ